LELIILKRIIGIFKAKNLPQSLFPGLQSPFWAVSGARQRKKFHKFRIFFRLVEKIIRI